MRLLSEFVIDFVIYVFYLYIHCKGYGADMNVDEDRGRCYCKVICIHV